MSFKIFQKEKTPFQAIKTRSSKRRKVAIFPKGLTHGFGPEMAILQFLFQAISARKMSFTIFQKEKTPIQAIKTRSLKSRKVDIFPKWLTHGFGRKIAIFSNFFFLGYIGQENVFYDILERKKAFLGYKNKKFNMSKSLHFSKGVNPWFWFKNCHFSSFFFKAIQARKISFTIFQQEKNAFLGYKNKMFKKSKS